MRPYAQIVLIITLATLAATPGTASTQKAGEALKSSRAKYLENLHGLSRDYTEKEQVLAGKYEKSLQSLLNQQTSRGNLDYVLAIKNEIARFRNRDSSKTAPAAQGSLRKMQASYAAQLNRIETEKSTRIASLVKQYSAFLERTERRLTSEGNIDEALLYRQERNTVKIIPPNEEKAALPPLTDTKKPDKGFNKWSMFRPEDFVNNLVFSIGQSIFPLPHPSGEINPGQLRMFNGAQAGKDGLNLTRGYIRAEEARFKLLEACRTSGEITLETVVETSDLNQTGPARIITFSSGAHQRNFTLGQEGRELIFRLRTAESDDNGMKFAQALSTIQADRPYHLVITYSPGEFRCWVNGEQVVSTDAVLGDFSNWTEQHLIFGNEHNENRLWNGRIPGVTILNRAVPEKSVLYAYRQAYRERHQGPFGPRWPDRNQLLDDW